MTVPGNTWRSVCTFLGEDGKVTDPDIVAATVKQNGQIIATYTFGSGEIVRDSKGAYHLDILSAGKGSWLVDWTGTSDDLDLATYCGFVVEDH